MAISAVQLGGELTGRSIFGGNRNAVEWTGLGVSVGALVIVQFMLLEHVWTVLPTAVLLFAAVFVWSPRPGLGHRSVMGIFGIRLRHRYHALTGRLDFLGSEGEEHKDGLREVKLPGVLGKLRLYEVEMWPGREDPGRVVILRHRSHEETTYVAVFEFRARPAGLMSKVDSSRNHDGWSKFQASLARQGSLVRYLQQVSRVVPYDPADHTSFILDNIQPSASEMLVRSYAQLVDTIERDLEQNRTWLVVGIPATAALHRAVNHVRLGEDGDGQPIRDGQRAIETVIAAQLRTVVSRARAQEMELRPLEERRFAAVCRSLQDPDEPLDRVAEASLLTMWLPWIGSEDPTMLRIQGERSPWYTRTAVVSRDGISPGVLPVDLLVPLLTGVTPAVTRTVSTHFTLVPANQAREQARTDVTTDESVVRSNVNIVSDGTSETQRGVSRQRLWDLRPGSGNHGSNWSMALTVQARTPEEMEDAVNRIEEATADAHISSLTWQDRSQHLALPLTLPLATGLKRARVRQ